MKQIEAIEKIIKAKKAPAFQVGNTLKVYLKVKEGEKTRTQLFEGVCIRKRGQGINASFTVLKESHGDKVEKTFPLYSPSIEKVTVSKKKTAKRAKLYHLKNPKTKVK